MAGLDSEKPPARTNEMIRRFQSPGQADQAVRQAMQLCWMTLPGDRQTLDELEAQVRRLMERAIRDLREDFEAFGFGI